VPAPQVVLENAPNSLVCANWRNSRQVVNDIQNGRSARAYDISWLITIRDERFADLQILIADLACLALFGSGRNLRATNQRSGRPAAVHGHASWVLWVKGWRAAGRGECRGL
jgi:hypothetical protein